MKHYRKSHRYKRRKPIYRNRFFWFFLLFLIAVVSLCYFVFFTPFFKIKEIGISGNEKISIQDIGSIAQEEVDSKGSLFFRINVGKIEENILMKYPEIGLADVKMRLPDKLSIKIQERQMVALWCVGENDCFKVDENGIVFEKIEEVPVGEIIINDSYSQGEKKTGEQAIDKDDLAKILQINFNLEKNLNIQVAGFFVSSTDKLVAVAEDGWELYFNLQNDIDWQLMKLKVLLEERISSEERQDLEYIELRFGNFANPKFRGVSTP
ncbi:MAG TPA: FtsQ-type POTRA domain-containing protein [Candidatus Paceibacterota bacterium]|nr:FtsQ-type POTRA domain-containing protein [Candidatus Paceibacterota bacterium]